MTGPILRLTSTQTTKPVYVNFARIQVFYSPESGGTWIGLAPDQGVSVQETPEQIVERLGDTDSVWVGVE